MEITMKLTPEQEAILNGSKGEAMAKVMRTRFGNTYYFDYFLMRGLKTY